MVENLFRMKLKTKAALTVGGILVLTLGITTFMHVRNLTTELQQALQAKPLLLGQGLVKDISKVLDFGLALEDIEDLSQKCQNLVAEHDDLAYALVVDQEGVIRFHNDQEMVSQTVDKEFLGGSDEPEGVLQNTVKGKEGKIYNTLIPILDNRNQYRGAVILGLKGEVVSGQVIHHIWTSTLTGALSFAVTLFLIVLFITSQIGRPLNHLIGASAAVAKGDLTQKIETVSHDEIGELYTAFSNMLNSLRELQERVAASFQELEHAVGDVTTISSFLQSGSEKQSRSLEEISTFITRMNDQTHGITKSMERLSRTSEETSSSIMEMMASIEQVAQNSESLSGAVNQTSSSMEEVLVSTKEVAQNIDHLNQLIIGTSAAVTEIDASVKEVEALAQDSRKFSEEVKGKAQKEGGSAVQETITEMNQIRGAVLTLSETVGKLGTSVDNIGEILNVIDDVAEQTNLLALNASIIAAQAGEHGRGFAVVADEIRELAERTSSSTKEISQVITGIQNETKNVSTLVREGVGRVDRGVDAVGRTDEALKKIIASSEKAVEMSNRIAQATREQSSGSRNVAKSIHDVSERASQISRATTEQSRGSETIVQAIENMRELAEQVRKATVEQTTGARLISKASEGSTLLSQEVTKSSREGKELSDRVVAEVTTIRNATNETLEAVSRMNQMVEKFGTLSSHLKKTLSQFRT